MRRLGSAILVGLTACSGPGGVVADAGPPDATALAGPIMTPCPAGWREALDEPTGVVVCDPWPESGEPSCAGAEVALPGAAACAAVGAACPAGDFPEGLPADRPILYVRAGAPAGGDGSAAAPLGTIAEALARVTQGTIVALAPGVYDEAVTLPPGTTLWGACAAATHLAPSTASSAQATLTTSGGAAEARNLSVGGPRPGIRAVGGELLLEGVVVAGAAGYGVIASGGARLTMRGAAVRDTAPVADGLAIGLVVGGGSSADLDGVAIERSRVRGIHVEGTGATLTARRVVVRDTTFGAGNLFYSGEGLGLVNGGHATVAESAFERNYRMGVAAWHASLEVADVVVRGTRGDPGTAQAAKGWCLLGLDSAVVARRLLCDANQARGIVMGQGVADGTFTDLVVRDTLPPAAPASIEGAGLQADLGARLVLERALLARNARAGLFVLLGAVATLRDVSIVDMRFGNDPKVAVGLVAQDDGEITGERVRVLSSFHIGVQVVGAQARVSLTDAVVDVVSPAAGDPLAVALEVIDEASAELNRFVLRASGLVGVQLARGGVADLHDGEISRHPIGANVQTEGFDLARIQDRVRYLDNEINLDSSAVAVPDPVPPDQPGP